MTGWSKFVPPTHETRPDGEAVDGYTDAIDAQLTAALSDFPPVESPDAARKRKSAAKRGKLRRCALHHFHAGEHMFVRTRSQILLSGECPAMEVLR